ncbi:MAG TPA: tetratricopeptide repeat protein [Gammaproteobacteria bacterium]|nr:tetratricopeptide repeat protein [Gammaproteobacteria bacterium]MDP7154670.1 tetratricopeptide repeat protein [Gammaproteobacteria bacterium]HJP39810.1 tetratricopeptide repeat protein [Gammaproteobacteria bacterium]
MHAKYIVLLKHAQQYLASGDLERAASSCKQAITLEPASAEGLNLLGMIIARQGDCEQAIVHLKAARKYEPRSPVIHNNLGRAYLNIGKFEQAKDCFKQAIDFHPDFTFAHMDLGQVYHALGDMDAADACFKTALAKNPQYAPAHVAWANMLYARGDLPAAATHYQQALTLQDDHHAHLWLAHTLSGMGHYQKASELYMELAATAPDYPGLQNSLGQALFQLGRVDEAIACLQKAISFAPDSPVPHNSLGNVFSKLGMPREAIRSFRAALAVDPGYAKAHSNLLLNMNYVEDEQRNIYSESLRFDARQTPEANRLPVKLENVSDPDRKLRIGYVSGDFRSHSVAYFALPLFEAHDRNCFEIFCYSNHFRLDEITEQFQSLADHWINIRGMSDDGVAAQIRRDRVDILVDMSGHTGENRLPVFTRKPAPVSVNWVGYPNTTGISAINYRITDFQADPTDSGLDEYYSEQLIRLPDGFLCYRSDARSSPVAPSPEAKCGYITFGSFNTLAKVTVEVVAAWAEILMAVPGSRLVLKAQSLEHQMTRVPLQALFAEQGIGAERLEFIGMLPKVEHYRFYSKIDIALDTFPYNGTTTTCEALWMGVPVITLSGTCHAGRVGASLLHQAGLTEFIAYDRATYLSLARSLAGDPDRRSVLRVGLRGQLQNSALMNQTAFAKQMENAYRQIWAAWCGEQQ